MISDYLKPLKDSFEANTNSEDAFFMKKYLKDQFEHYGIKTPKRTELSKEFLKEYGLPSKEELPEVIRELWNQPQRDYQYFAIRLLEKMIDHLCEKHLELLEYLIVTKSWWDSVDGLAAWIVGKVFHKYPELIKTYTEKWMASENMWLQRTCLLFQLKYKEKTDTKLLFKYIIKLSDSKEFFIQKAIGWILREYSKTNPEAVSEFVNNNTLATLSRKEALRLMNK